MYNWIENTIGIVPNGYEWIYGVGTILLFIAFIILLISPLLIIFSIFKYNKRR